MKLRKLLLTLGFALLLLPGVGQAKTEPVSAGCNANLGGSFTPLFQGGLDLAPQVRARIEKFLLDFEKVVPPELVVQIPWVYLTIDKTTAKDFQSGVAPLTNQVWIGIPEDLLSSPDAPRNEARWRHLFVMMAHELGHAIFEKRLYLEFPILRQAEALAAAEAPPEGHFQTNDRFVTENLALIGSASKQTPSEQYMLRIETKTLRTLSWTFHEFVADAIAGIYAGHLDAVGDAFGNDGPYPHAESCERRRFSVDVRPGENFIDWLKPCLETNYSRAMAYYALQPAKFRLSQIMPNLRSASARDKQNAIRKVSEVATKALGLIWREPPRANSSDPRNMPSYLIHSIDEQFAKKT